ncbi:hypothetical protein F5X98DRAFT_368641 [Xylaria grammica]|nr:hypothetical protein F5X98DRAFT_368641 [Xylaria grammica]
MPTPEFLCGNWVGSRDGCTKRGIYACKNCRLINYCSSECQKSHWHVHKTDCKSFLGKYTWQPSWVLENRKPAFMQGGLGASFGTKKYLWGNVPAYDVLHLHSNEGDHYDGHISLLFAASGDLRHVVETIAQLPETYNQPITVTLNDRDINIVARNTILLLIALVGESIDEAIDCIIHVWYSALLRRSDNELLQHRIRPLIQDFCLQIAGERSESIVGKIWTFGQRSLKLVQKKSSWDATLSYFEPPTGLAAKRAQNIRTAVTLAASRVDYTDRSLYLLSPSHRIASRRFREDGLLLPFGFPRHDFTDPNPTFFHTEDSWPMKDSADPQHGWSTEKVAQTSSGPATADLYGKIFYFLRATLRCFLVRLSESAVSFQLFSTDVESLPDTKRFAFAQTSNIADKGWFGIHKTLATLGPFLQAPDINPHATLITSFINAVDENLTQQDRMANITPNSAETKTLLKYLHVKRAWASEYDPDLIKFQFGRDAVSRCDYVFDRHLKELRLKEWADLLGMAIKDDHTIIEKWPYRLKLRPGQPGAQAEFDRLLASGVSGKERYVEWRLVDA